jgi:uncharacterized protein
MRRNGKETAMQQRDDFPFQVIEEPDLGIVLSDGCRLSARIWRAEGAGPVPAVLEYIPYRKRDGTLPRDEIMHAYVACGSICAAMAILKG